MFYTGTSTLATSERTRQAHSQLKRYASTTKAKQPTPISADAVATHLRRPSSCPIISRRCGIVYSVNVPLHRLEPFPKLTDTLGERTSDEMRRFWGGGSSTQYLGLGRRRWGSEVARVGGFLPLRSPRGISLQDENSKGITESRCVLLTKVVRLALSLIHI